MYINVQILYIIDLEFKMLYSFARDFLFTLAVIVSD